MARKNSNSQRHNSNKSAKSPGAKPAARVDIPNTNKQRLSLYIPQSRRKNPSRRKLASPIQIRSPTVDIAAGENGQATNGHRAGVYGGEDEEEEQSDEVDDDNICLVCVAKCICGKTEQPRVHSPKRHSPSVSPFEPHLTRQRMKLRPSSPTPKIQSPDNLSTRHSRPFNLRSPESTPIKIETNGDNYDLRSHANVIVRDGRGPGKNVAEKLRRVTDAKSDIVMEISEVNLDSVEEDEDEEDEDDESDDLGDSGDDVDIEGEEERAIIAEESRRLRSYSDRRRRRQ